MTRPWEADYPDMTPDQQESVEVWLGTNVFIAEKLGFDLDAWSDIVEWAFENPGDYTFIKAPISVPGEGDQSTLR